MNTATLGHKQPVKPKSATVAGRTPKTSLGATSEEFPKLSPWAKEFKKRLAKLHKALDGQKLA